VVYLTVEVQVLAEDWRIEYNTYRPHRSPDFVTPEAFRQHWLTKENNRGPVKVCALRHATRRNSDSAPTWCHRL